MSSNTLSRSRFMSLSLGLAASPGSRHENTKISLSTLEGEGLCAEAWAGQGLSRGTMGRPHKLFITNISLESRASFCLQSHEVGGKSIIKYSFASVAELHLGVQVRPPMPPRFFFVIDVSYVAVTSGALPVICQAVRDSLDRLPGGERTQVGFLTFDSTLHFYNLAARLTQPQMMVRRLPAAPLCRGALRLPSDEGSGVCMTVGCCPAAPSVGKMLRSALNFHQVPLCPKDTP